MSIALLVITDGRVDYLRQTVQSCAARLAGPISERWMFDDTGDADHRRYLADRYPEFTHTNAGPRQGFGGAIRAAWAHLAAASGASVVAHVEQDFTFNRLIDLAAIAEVLEANPELVQLALRRQPWNDAEREAGGIVELYPDAYVERVQGEHRWLETRRNFTTNPCLYRRSLCDETWPDGEQSEGRFGLGLLERHPTWRFGFWGARNSGEWVTHIGRDRAGVGY